MGKGCGSLLRNLLMVKNSGVLFWLEFVFYILKWGEEYFWFFYMGEFFCEYYFS